MPTSERREIQRFEVVEHLGTGGMGSVFRAWDPQLERDVAIKVLLDSSSGAPSDPASRSIHEARGTRQSHTTAPRSTRGTHCMRGWLCVS
jgi:serine/threonine protein kinase